MPVYLKPALRQTNANLVLPQTNLRWFKKMSLNIGNLLSTAACQEHALQIEFQVILHFNIYTFWHFSGFHKGCTLGTLLATGFPEC